MLKYNPAVFAVNDKYQIIIPVTCASFARITVADAEYYSASNGIMHCSSDIHKIEIPAKTLNEAGAYKVFIRPVIERRSCGAVTEPEREYDFCFFAPPADRLRFYTIADAHSLVAEPIAAAKAYGRMDALILNGDIINACDSVEDFFNVYKMCSELTAGCIPVVSARGNHDMRGRLADRYSDYMPAENGKLYYTFRLGSLWGVVLDCGEITRDANAKHGFTVCCDPFRREQTAFLKRIVSDAKNEYNAEGVKHRMVLVHDPFFEKHAPPHDVARDIYREWFDIIIGHIDPHLWICGHHHLTEVRRPPYSLDEFGIKTPLVVASKNGKAYFCGSGFDVSGEGVSVVFTDSDAKKSEPIIL